MKIYVNITADDNISFSDFIENKNLISDSSLRYAYGVFCIDNISKSLSTNIPDALPKSFVLQWDYKKIDDLFENRIIGRFNEGKLKWTLEDPMAMAPMIRVLMYGMEKYDRDNWKKACPSRFDLMDSLERHCKAIIAGESVDPESGLPHIGHLMCNAMFYSYWEQKTDGLFEHFNSGATTTELLTL